MRVTWALIAGVLILGCGSDDNGGDENGNGTAGQGGVGGGEPPPVAVDVLWDCACSYPCGPTTSISQSRSPCRPTEEEARQAAEAECNAGQKMADNCGACSCPQCSTNNASCRREDGSVAGSGGSQQAPAGSLHCCALEKLCSRIGISANPCTADASIWSAIAAGDEQGCQAELDNAVLDVQVADCATDPDCLYTEADALAECQ
jgi:hypothetical protein